MGKLKLRHLSNLLLIPALSPLTPSPVSSPAVVMGVGVLGSLLVCSASGPLWAEPSASELGDSRPRAPASQRGVTLSPKQMAQLTALCFASCVPQAVDASWSPWLSSSRGPRGRGGRGWICSESFIMVPLLRFPGLWAAAWSCK